VKRVLNWSNPIFTLCLWMATLLIAWHDLLPYSVAMLVFAQVGVLLVLGSWTEFGMQVSGEGAGATPRVHVWPAAVLVAVASAALLRLAGRVVD